MLKTLKFVLMIKYNPYIFLNGAKLFHFNFVVWSIFATFALSIRQRDLLNHEVLRIEKEAK
nr:MAG TPA: hypothetical protein [Caudoviricetes sp.]